MNNYVLSCCSTADLTDEHFAKRDINYICFHFYLNDEHYMDDLEKSMKLTDFYQAMVDGADTHTSQVNAEEYMAYFEKFLKEGKDIVHCCLSSGISGTLNSALIAKAEMEEKYPDRKVYVIDSTTASAGFGLFMDKLADLRDQGMSAKEVADWAEANKARLNAWFFCTDLTFLIRGGRVSKTAGTIAGIVGICPLLKINSEGKLVSNANVRGKKKVYKEIVNRMKDWADDGVDYSDKCYISNSMCLEDATAVANLINETFPNMKEPTQIYNIGTTIGSHTGPGTVAVFFWGKERTI